MRTGQWSSAKKVGKKERVKVVAMDGGKTQVGWLYADSQAFVLK